MRTNKTSQIGDFLQQQNYLNKEFDFQAGFRQTEHDNPLSGFTKSELWNMFKNTFYSMYGKSLQYDDTIIENLKILFFYFLRDNKFFECENLFSDSSKPSFKKGLLIVGGFGLGKTDYFKVFESVFRHHPVFKFKFYSSMELVRNFEKCVNQNDKLEFYKCVKRKLIFIDDVNSEREGSNYGKVEVIPEILSIRYDNKLKTYMTANYTNAENCVNQTLIDLGKRYGSRIYDRFFEMFNIIEFKGKSFRI
ncbi:hypothetical protein [uncultured Winogradskyella sp.]|uniref:hypothetical protein n=1 Tax=uncultured Winogradskyella sp. TaxID=395353 RepID=UPI002605E9EF|nr:hypothetical protein [uncultured Winogradskyella sp.]